MKDADLAESVLMKLFGSTSRVRILSLFLRELGASFYQREVMYETGLSLQATQRELGNLAELEIVKREDKDSRVYYRINGDSPLIRPLTEILSAASRITDRRKIR